MKKMSSATSATAIAIAVALTATGCSAGATQPDAAPPTTDTDTGTLDGLVEAAKAEGKVIVYSSLPERDQEKLATGFTEAYGIEVESLRLGGNSLATRFESETEAGSPSADVVLSTALEFLKSGTDDGLLVPFEETGVDDHLNGLPENATLDDYAGAPIFQVMSTGFIYNSNLVSAQDIPDTWGEFVASDLVTQACAVAPDTSESLMVFMSSLREAEGDDVLTELGQKVSRWYPSVIPMNEAVAAGECAIGLNSAEFFTHAMKAQGASVEFAPAQTAVYPVVSAAVSADARHPSAARLFLLYSLSEEGSATVNDPGVGSYGALDADDFPAGFDVLSPSENAEVLDSSQEIMRLLGL